MDISTNHGESKSMIIFPEHFQGYTDVVHGGILSTVLDEIAVYAGMSLGKKCVTGEISVRFKRPVEIGIEYIVEGKVVNDRNRLIDVESCIKNAKGDVYASAEVRLVRVNE